MARIPKRPRSTKPDLVCQFLIVLANTDPLVWRRIQMPEQYSFWDLHVAIQDVMGWQDYHLHEFTMVNSVKGKVLRIGIPDDEMPDERPCLAGWTVPIARHFTHATGPVRYLYDFGDGWQHIVEFEDHVPTDDGVYPRCVGGASACPPEDVGGTTGYAEFRRVIGNPRHPEHKETLQWAGGAFDPSAFNPAAVTFDDPAKRWQIAFGGRR